MVGGGARRATERLPARPEGQEACREAMLEHCTKRKTIIINTE